jgi:hypothetical protein
MSDDLRQTIYLNFSQRDTEELLEIWRAHDREQWSETAFDVIREILQERQVELPQESQPTHSADRSSSAAIQANQQEQPDALLREQPFTMTFLQRLLGIVLFRPAAYRYIATNSDLTTESSLIALIVAFLGSAVYTWRYGLGWLTAWQLLVPIFVGWLLYSWLSAWVADRFFKNPIPVAGILRARGHAQIFGVLGVLVTIFGPLLGSLGSILNYGAWALTLIASILCIREAGRTSTKRAIAILVMSGIVIIFVVWFVATAATLIYAALTGSLFVGD